MCIVLWRRYFCPKAPDFQPLVPPQGGRQEHPSPSETLLDHHLLLEDQNVYRESGQDPEDGVPVDMHIHWLRNVIRCAHRYFHQCVQEDMLSAKVQHINGACPYCMGDIDTHVEDHSMVTGEFEARPRIPGPDEEDEQLDAHFEAYKEYYLLRLLRLVMRVLMKPVPMMAQSLDWCDAMRAVWPETWCKRQRAHIGHASDDCDCLSMREEWRTNTAFSMRKNEANAVLDHIEQTVDGGEVHHYWARPLVDMDDGGIPDYNWGIQPRALDIYGEFRTMGFPEWQMEYVNLSKEVYERRLWRLIQRAVGCRVELKHRGKAVSEAYPASAAFMSRRIHWFDRDNWDDTLMRRQVFLNWMYQFLARDAGLDEEIMMYLGGALLAILNPWPNPRFRDHPSHPRAEMFDPQLAARDVMQECVYWVEYHWPLDGSDHIMTNLLGSVDATERQLEVIDRNRDITMRDIVARNRFAEARTAAFSRPVAEADADDNRTCMLCQETWNHFPFHEPVRLPCCRHHIGRRCLKQWLAQKEIRGAAYDEYETPATWAAHWKCMICRSPMAPHFAPNVNLGFAEGPADIRHLNFHNNFESRPMSPEYD